MAQQRNQQQRPQQQQRPDQRQQAAPGPSSGRLAELYGWTPEQVDVVRRSICVNASDDELHLFLATARRLELDPFARQIWFVRRKQKIEDDQGGEQYIHVGRPEIGIDGLRTIAERTGEYRGQDDYQWCGADGEWRTVWTGKSPPVAARARVHREGHTAFYATAHFEEYCPRFKNGGTSPMWSKMPANQIAKCAEAQAFRRTFPLHMSGIHTDDEMAHVGEIVSGAGDMSAPARAAAPVTDETKLLAAKAQADVDLGNFITAVVAATNNQELAAAKEHIARWQGKDVVSVEVRAKAKEVYELRQAELRGGGS